MRPSDRAVDLCLALKASTFLANPADFFSTVEILLFVLPGHGAGGGALSAANVENENKQNTEMTILLLMIPVYGPRV